MQAPLDCSPDDMLRALGYTLAALTTAIEIDPDRSSEDKTFFRNEIESVHPLLTAVETAHHALQHHEHTVLQQEAARTLLGDAVLDRAVRASKQRMKLAYAGRDMSAVDEVFPSDISDITDADRAVEPDLVLELVARLRAVTAFPERESIADDLVLRAERQKTHFAHRASAEQTGYSLELTLATAIAAASRALTALEARLFERFPRQTQYVRAFFLEFRPVRKRQAVPPT